MNNVTPDAVSAAILAVQIAEDLILSDRATALTGISFSRAETDALRAGMLVKSCVPKIQTLIKIIDPNIFQSK